MTTAAVTTSPPTGVAARDRAPGRVLRTGLLAVLVASTATMTVAALGRAAGIGLEVGGVPIPV